MTKDEIFEKLQTEVTIRGLRICPHKRLSRVEMLEILTIVSSEETEIS